MQFGMEIYRLAFTTSDGHIWGTASQWTTNDHCSTWNFTRTSVLTGMVRHGCYEHSWLTHCFQVPVIAVFTKYDQFLRNVEMHLTDYPNEYPGGNVPEVAENLFQEHYLHPLGSDVRYVRLESEFGVLCRGYMLIFLTEMHMPNRPCNGLLENTAAALNDDVIALMLLAVQRGNLELSVNMALNRWVSQLRGQRGRSILTKIVVPTPLWILRLNM